MSAPARSKEGGSAGCSEGSGSTLRTLKAATRSGMPSSSQVPRYSRALTGRSSEPWRGRRRGGRGGDAAMPGYSRSKTDMRRQALPMPDSSTILLVDDEDAVQKLLAFPLERDGFRVVQARDGQEALERFGREEHVDLVVLDVMLPKLDGLEVCKRLRATSNVPIIM